MKNFMLILMVGLFVTGCVAGQSVHQNNSTSKDPYANKVTRENNVKVDYSFPQAEEVWYENDSKLVSIEGEAGYVEGSIGQAFKQAFLFSFTNKFAILANGTKAFDIVKGNHHVFYIRNKPTESGIARLTVQNQKNRRFVWAVNRVGSNEANFYPPEDAIAFRWAKTQKGVYKITISDNLSTGEYAIITPDPNKKGYYFYGFSVEN